jgi:hypothetical protein
MVLIPQRWNEGIKRVNLMYYTLHIYRSSYEQRSNKRNGSKNQGVL